MCEYKNTQHTSLLSWKYINYARVKSNNIRQGMEEFKVLLTRKQRRTLENDIFQLSSYCTLSSGNHVLTLDLFFCKMMCSLLSSWAVNRSLWRRRKSWYWLAKKDRCLICREEEGEWEAREDPRWLGPWTGGSTKSGGHIGSALEGVPSDRVGALAGTI